MHSRRFDNFDRLMLFLVTVAISLASWPIILLVMWLNDSVRFVE